MRILQKALTFDDVLLVPAHSRILPRDVSLSTRLTRNISLNLPLLSAAMDTVTEGRLAIALAQEGGIGIIHKNLSPKAQAAEVAKVKRFESGILKDPITVSPLMTVRDVLEITSQYRISGLPVIDRVGKVVGIVTNRDLRFETNLDQPVKAIMTPRKRLVTVKEGASVEDAKELLRAPPGEGSGHRRRVPSARPDHRQGHPQVHRTSAGQQGCLRTLARRRGGRCRSRHRRACRATCRGRGRRGHRRHCPRALAGRTG